MTDTSDSYSADTSTFGGRVTGAREAIGLDQPGLARMLGVETKTLDAWEQDMTEPRANKLLMLSGALGVSLRWLLEGNDDDTLPPAWDSALPLPDARVLTELRLIRTEMNDAVDRLTRIENRLRLALLEAGK